MKFRYKKSVLWVLVILQISLIFSFSLQKGDVSSVLSEGITKKIKSKQQLELEISQEKDENGEKLYNNDYAIEKTAERKFNTIEKVIRKMAHAFLFFMLGIFLILLMLSYKTGRKLAIVLSVLFSGTTAFLDETIQLFTEDRAGMFTDVLIDISGAVFAAIIFFVGGLLYEKIKIRRSNMDS